jgi:hypothetical protein
LRDQFLGIIGIEAAGNGGKAKHNNLRVSDSFGRFPFYFEGFQ